ncbi:hypothetical protein DB30_05863 [Enhygromyxa salina]|uniref:HTH lysR-type domain-containing protein n=1 Tax=Enhygromyxa salina TaxID=215803 RepID=A0A0C1ZVT8_9BACT|nr:LysR family transcriptional regulator [Enhygromyxa salina]KIG15163.1 hypothetical protein DB30_05863 [Enhygromyxa salina]
MHDQHLGEELLARTTRSIRITARGAALLEYADEIFARSYEVNHVFRDKNESLVPTNIRIGMVGGISRVRPSPRIASRPPPTADAATTFGTRGKMACMQFCLLRSTSPRGCAP